MSNPSMFGDHDILANIHKFTQEAQSDPSMIDGGADDPGIEQGGPSAPQPQQPQAPTDFSGQQGGAPMDLTQQPQGVPPQQQPAGAPTPNLMPNNPTALTPASTLNSYAQNRADNQGAANQAIDQQKQALVKQSEIAQAQNDITSQYQPVLNKLDEDYFRTRAGIDNTHMQYTQMALDHQQKNIAHLEQLAQQNPHNFWGNSSTSNKIGAIIGMIGAGLHGDNATDYFQKIVNNSVAESHRKQGLYHQIGMTQHQMDQTESQGYQSHISAIETRRAAGYKIIGNQIAQRIQLTANPMERAKLEEQLGKLNALSAKESGLAADKDVVHQLAADKLKIEQQNADSASLTAGASMMRAQREPANGMRTAPLAGFSSGNVLMTEHGKIADTLASTRNTISLIDDSLKKFQNVKPGNIEQTRDFIKSNGALIEGEIRKIVGTGAAYTGTEKQSVEALKPQWEQVVKGKLGVSDFMKQLHHVEKILTRRALITAQAHQIDPLQLDKNDRLYGIENEAEQGEAAEQKEITDSQRANDILAKYGP